MFAISPDSVFYISFIGV